MAGIAAPVITAVMIWWFTHPDGTFGKTPGTDDPIDKPKVMDISGTWLTLYNNLRYEVTQQHNDTFYHWNVPDHPINGNGKISNNTVTFGVFGNILQYNVIIEDSEGNPTVLYTDKPGFEHLVFFKSCSDLKKFIDDYFVVNSPLPKNEIYNAVKSIPNPTCPNILD